MAATGSPCMSWNSALPVHVDAFAELMSTIGIKLEAQWKGSHNNHCISRMSLAECGVDWGAGGKVCE